MNKRNLTLIGFMFIVLAPQQSLAAGIYQSVGACTDLETWSPSASLPRAWAPLVAKFFSPKSGALSDYNVAYLLAERLKTTEGQAIASYWMARSLHRMRFIHLAYEGFARTFELPYAPQTLGVRMAALECLNQINRNYANMPLPKEAALKLFEIPSQGLTAAHREAIQEAAFTILKSGHAESLGKDGKQRLFSLLRGPGGFEFMALGFQHVQDGDYVGAIGDFKRYFSVAEPRPVFLKNFDDPARLLLARSYYEIQQWELSSEEFKKIKRESNYLPQALSDASWAFVRRQKYNEAVGTALSLQTGGLARTFAPEAPVVVAISLVELCHFPEALKQLKIFTKSYFPSYKWLHDWSTTAIHPKSLYELALDFVRKKPEIPYKVGTEWLRSPIFLTNQKEINLLNDETHAGNIALGRIRAIPRLQSAPNYKGYVALSNRLGSLISEIPGREIKLVSEINETLVSVNKRLVDEIAESAENAQLVEVEIYNSAGEDMIKKNARPDAYTAARKIAQSDKGEIWRWGKLPTNLDERVEVWDDELGFLKGDLTDQCPKSASK